MWNHLKAAAATTATAALTLSALCACSAAPGSSTPAGNTPTTPAASAAPAGPPVFTTDQASWALPLDDYRPDVRDLERAGDAGYAACMTANGYPTPAVDVAASIPSTRNRVLYSLFDTDIAQRFGYHAGPAPDPTASAGPAEVPESGAGRAQATSCSATAQDALHVDAGAMARVQNLALAARSQAEAAPDVVAAATRWATCMAPLAIADLPTHPVEMPSDSQRARYHEENLQVPGSDVTRASSDEITRAVHDARCRDSSEYTTRLYGAEVAAQLRLMAGDSDDLDAALAATRRTDTAAEAVR